MGCLKRLIIKLLVIAGIILFLISGGWIILRNQIDNFKNPAREIGIEGAKYFGDFEGVSSDYQIGRTVGAFGYKRLKVTNRPSSQKILFLELKDKEYLTLKDFSGSGIEEKMDEFVKKFDNKFLGLEHLTIINKGVYQRKNPLNYAVFEADVKNIPFKKVEGVIGIYQKKDDKNREHQFYVFSMRDKDKFSMKIFSDLIGEIK